MVYEERRELKEFNSLFKEMMDLYYETALRSGISNSAYDIFYAMVEMGDGCLQKDIADYYHMSRTTVNSYLKKLEVQGYIFMEKGGGKNKLLHLTDRGKQLVQERIIPVMDMENSIFGEMNNGDGKEFLRLLRDYVAIYRKKMKERGMELEYEKENSTV